MTEGNRTLIAIVLSVAIFAGWNIFFKPKTDSAPSISPTNTSQQAVTANESSSDHSTSLHLPSTKKEPVDSKASTIPVKTWTMETPLLAVTVSNDGGVVTHWKLQKYNSTTDLTSPPTDLAMHDIQTMPALTLTFENANFYFPKTPRYEIISADKRDIRLRWQSKEVEIIKHISLHPNTYMASIDVEVTNLTDRSLTGQPTLMWGASFLGKPTGLMGMFKQAPLDSMTPIYYLNNEAERDASVKKLPLSTFQTGHIAWSGLESRYFINVIIPRQISSDISARYGRLNTAQNQSGSDVWSGLSLSSVAFPSHTTTTSKFLAYAGPKDISMLKTANVHLEDAIDYGWFTVIAVPILYLLQFFYGLIQNYGVAIILLTVFVKLLLHPINAKSLKSMKAMSALQPELKAMKEKYANDKQRINQETMALFKRHGANPLGGCLPMLLQFPIYIALYKVLWNSIELYHAPFFWIYQDLSAPDPYYITPILLGIFMVAQQMLMPSASADPAQKKMMMMMPVMFTVLMLFLPVGLVVYILVNTVMSVTQQWTYNNGYTLSRLIKRS